MPRTPKRRKPQRKAHQFDWEKITMLLVVIIQVGGRIAQSWIERGGHLP